MTFSVLIWFTAFVGYTTTTVIEDLETYHVVTDFLPLHSTIIPKLCNETYSERNVTRQIAEKNETSGQFEIVCNISDNTGTTDNSSLQTCLSDVFINIEFHFSCNNSDQQQETFLASYPYHNITYNVTDSCDEPFLQELKLLNQSSDVYWSVCEKMSKTVMTNCSVRCNGNTCSINTICVREIDPRCLIPKYLRLTYECEQDSMNLENKEVLIYIDCGNNYLIDIEDISIQQKRQSCSRTQKQCFISNEDKTLINNACHNRRNCTKPFKLNSKCLYITEYAYYNMSYKCSNEELMQETSCHKINETITIKCNKTGQLEPKQLLIQFQPSDVADCLQQNNINFTFPYDVCSREKDKKECEINLIEEGLTDHPCLYVNTHTIHINHSCIYDPLYSNMSKGEVTLSHMFTIKPHRGTTKLIQVLSSTEMATTRIPDLTTTIMLSDSSTTSREEIQKAEQGPIFGGIVGSIAFVAIFVVLAVFFKRVHIMKKKTNGQSEGMVGSLIRQSSLKDYTGIQMVAYPGEGNEHLTNEIYRDISDNSQNRYVSDQKENFKRKERKIDSAKCATEYTLAKSIPNKLQLSNIQLEMTTSDCGYSMAKRISKEDKDGENCIPSNSDFVASNDYQDSPEGLYDQAKTRRKMNDIDVYARAYDGTYDTANHCAQRRTENDDIAYDHFTGPKTNDNYDLVITHNQVVGDETYGVN